MGKSCSYGLCKNVQGRSGCRFFQFPSASRDPERRRLWAVRCKRKTTDGCTWEPNPITEYIYVCSDHFITGEPWNHKNHPDYAPSVLCRTADNQDTQKSTQSLQRCSMCSPTTSAIQNVDTTCTPSSNDHSIQTICSLKETDTDNTSSIPSTASGDFTHGWRNTNVSRQKKKLCKKPKTTHPKDFAIPSVFPNASTGSYLSKTQVAPRVTSRATASSRYPEEENGLESLEQASLENDDISSLALTDDEEQPRGQKCDIPSKTTVRTTVRNEHFMNIAETLMKYREHGFLCDAVLVAKCGRELKAHSALLAAVSPVFLMAIEEKPSAGPYHLCFPEVEIEVLEIAVHFVYTGKLLLPTVYSQVDKLSMLFNKLSDLGLTLHKLHDCEMTFVRSAKQPPNSLKSIKAENSVKKTSLKESVQKLQASCDEWPVDKNHSSEDAFKEAMIIDIAPNDARTKQTSRESEKSSRSTLAKKKRQGNQEQERQQRLPRRTGNKNGQNEQMPNNAQVPTGTVVTKPVKRLAFLLPKAPLGDPNTLVAGLHSSGTSSQKPNNLPVGLLLDQNVGKINTLDSSSLGIHEAIINHDEEPNPKTQEDSLNLVDSPPTEGTLGPNGVETFADKASSSSTQAHACEHCTEPNAETFKSEIELVLHKIKHHWDQSNVCNYCGCKLSSRQNLKCHIQRHLGIFPRRIKKHKCNDCGLHFLSPAELKNHRVRHTGEKPHECPVCRKRFTLQGNMERHKLLHTGYHPFLCDFCGKGFTRKMVLIKHVTVHHELECAICSCKQTSKADMEKHTLEVHKLSLPVKFNLTIKNPWTYLCELCGKNCVSAYSLRQHIHRHGKKPILKKRFKCAICNNQFTSAASLVIHNRVHTGEKPFRCSLCSKQFNTKGSLTIHIRSHTGVKPFTCTVCEASFAQSQHLGRHMQTHTGEKPFVCEICSKGYRSKVDLRIHFMNFHKIDVTLKSLSENIETDRKDASDTSVSVLWTS